MDTGRDTGRGVDENDETDGIPEPQLPDSSTDVDTDTHTGSDTGTGSDSGSDTDSETDPDPMPQRIGYQARAYDCTPPDYDGPVVHVAVDGNDGNSGSALSPFATVNRAVAHFGGTGGVIYVREGVHRPSMGPMPKFVIDESSSTGVLVNQGGTETQPLRICAFPGEMVIFDGSHLSETTTLFFVEDTSWVDITGLVIAHSNGNGLEVAAAENVRIRGNIIRDNRMTGLLVRGTFWGDIVRDRSRNVRVDGNHIHHNMRRNSGDNRGLQNWGAGAQARNAEGIHFINNRIVENWGEGLGLVSVHSSSAEGNTIVDNWSVNLYFDNAQGCIARNNFIMATGHPEMRMATRDTNLVQMANEYYVDFLGDTPEFYLSDNTLENNVLVGGNEGFHYGIYSGAHSSAPPLALGLKQITITRNTFFGHQQLFYIVEDDHTRDVEIHHNVFSSPHMTDLSGIMSFVGLNFHSNNWHGLEAGSAGDIGDVYGDPGFERPGGMDVADYQLSPSSEAMGSNMGAMVF